MAGEALGLTLRGIAFRRAASLAAYAVAVLGTAAAVLGPMYAHSAEDSLVRESVREAAPFSTSLAFAASDSGQMQNSPSRIRDSLQSAAAQPGLDRWFAPSTLRISVKDVPVLSGTRQLGLANLTWHDDHGCKDVKIVEGSCPSHPHDAMVSEGTANDYGLKVGNKLLLEFGSSPKGETMRLVGVYDVNAKVPTSWGLDDPRQAAPPPGINVTNPAHLDELLMTDDLLLTTSSEVHVDIDRALIPDRVHVSGAPALEALLAQVQNTTQGDLGVDYTATAPLLGLLQSLDHDRSLVRTASLAVTVQLALVAWFVLFVIVSATAEERAAEIALAKLRGLRLRSAVWFALSETGLLLAAALPLGLLAGWLGAEVLVHRILAPGTVVELRTPVYVALLAAWLGGLLAAYVATRRTLTAPVLDQMRRTSSGRARLAGTIVAETAAVALAATGAYELHNGGSDVLALITPGALSLAVGLFSVRVLPLFARVAVARTRRSGRVASFLAIRAITRRQAGLRLVTLLVVAVGLATFAVDAWTVAGQTRSDEARLEVGAPRVLTVAAPTPGALVTDVRRADPQGRWAMAAVQADSGILAIDSARLPAVTTWDADGLGLSLATLAQRLHPKAGASLVVSGQLRLTVEGTVKPKTADLRLGMTVKAADGVESIYDLGLVRSTSRVLTRTLVGCEQGCTFVGFNLSLDVPLGVNGPLHGVAKLAITKVSDSSGPLDLTGGGKVRWRNGRLPSEVTDPESGPRLDAHVTAAGITATVSGAESQGILEVADYPEDLPAVVASGTNLTPFPQGQGAAYSPGIDGNNTVVAPLGHQTLLPRLLTEGVLVDLPYALLTAQAPAPSLPTYVWLGPRAPSDAAALLTKAGLRVEGSESVAERRAELNRNGTALALEIFIVAAFAAVVLAGGALLASTTAAARRRSYELAALRVLGARDRVLVRAGRREQLALTFVGLALGLASGLLGAWLAIPALPAVDGTGVLLEPHRGPAWLAVGAVALVFLVIGWAVAQASASRTVRLARLERLREAEA